MTTDDNTWEVLTYPDNRLRRVSAPIVEFTDDLRKKALALADLMHESHGIGLAAPQVGWHVRLVAINLSGDRRDALLFANPEVIERSKATNEAMEACLSVPGISGKVVRPKEIKIRCMNMDGEINEFELDGMLARCFLHEYDHLDGVLFIDRLSAAKKQSIKSKLRRLGGPE
ncbi:MAG: peptide deformylase [Nitrospira sp.]